MPTASNLAYFSHSLLYQCRQSIIVLIYSLTSLEINIIILCSTTLYRMVRIQGTTAESCNSIPVQNLAEILIINHFNLLNLMGSTETIKEIQERNTPLDSNQMSYCRKVHNLLYGGLCQHSYTSLASSHNILMITKDIQGRSSQSTCRNVEYAWEHLSGNLVHVRNHQQHTLGCSIGGGQCTSLQRTVQSTSCTSLRLKLYNTYLLTKKVFNPLSSHLINMLSHWRRWGNWIDGSNIGKCVGHISRSCVTIHSLHFLAHKFF